mmetsp:Transcript_12166/g.18277  ORF Transcript_12166/g.18277 Transcript_12166/m.18277 type:complete len:467 (-) Transcript_12166:36-1436(-)
MAPVPKRKSQRAPPIDQLIKPAIGIIVALMGYHIMKGVSVSIPRIDTGDELALREVFFGEGPYSKDYAVLCHSDADPDLPISSVFLDSFSEGSAPVDYVLLDCDYVLPSSGKSIAKRFKLDTSVFPTIFVSGKSMTPKQIPQKHLKTGTMLTKVLRKMLLPSALKIDSTRTLKQKCLDKDYCAVLLKGSGTVEARVKNAVTNLVTDYPGVQIASVDSTSNYLANLEEVLLDLSEYEEDRHRLVMFKKVSGSAVTPEDIGDEDEDEETPNKAPPQDSGRLITSVAVYESGQSFSTNNLADFIQNVQSGKIKAKKLSTLPSLKTRTKKVNAKIIAKRQKLAARKKQERESKQKGSAGGGAFGSTDSTNDSKADRKAERDRRRREHHAKNNVKPKTPEEIKAQEAARRKRMEEEAAKWNMMPEDLDDLAGDGVEESESFFEDFEDEDSEEIVDMDESATDDDEDILDLD